VTESKLNIDQPTLSHFATNSAKNNNNVKTILIQTDCLDNIIPKELPTHFIRIDVEGAEFQVIEGATNTIRMNKTEIVFEPSPFSQRYFGISSEMIYDLITNQCGLRISLLQHRLKKKIL
jgi:hypothetical protein